MKRKLLMTSADTWYEVDTVSIEQLKKDYPSFEIVVTNPVEVTDEQIAEAEIIYGQIDSSRLKLAEQLNWLMIPTAGVNQFGDQSIYYNQHTILTNSSGVFGIPIAEHILSYVLAFYKNTNACYKRQQECEWSGKDIMPLELFGKTVGIVGLGDIGSEAAKRFKAFGTTVLAVKKSFSDKPDYVNELFFGNSIEYIAKRADILVITVPYTQQTHGMINKEILDIMKESAVIVNIGRGGLIDQEALITALKNKTIGGAILDVTIPEPLPSDNELWTLDNVLITPHLSGKAAQTRQRRFNLFLENLRRYVQNQPLKNAVNFNKGY